MQKINDHDDTLFIIIPAYNESDNIRTVVKEWYPIIQKYGNKKSRLVVIDDGSKDNTFKILQQLQKKYPLLQPLTKPNAGHGATVLYGYNYAIDHHADYVFQTDSDGQTRPAEFSDFWKLRKEYDMVIGHRNAREDGFSRIIVTKILRRVIKSCFDVWITDANAPFRLMKAQGLSENIEYIPEDFNLANVILSVVYTKRSDQKVKYIPITFRPRQGGTNSINLPKITGIGKQALKDFREINKNLKNLE